MALPGPRAAGGGYAAPSARLLTPADRPSPGAARLPEPRTPLVGREVDVDRVVEAVERGRLVTVTGPGGVGKTRVAIEAARRLAGRYGDGAAFVPLAGVGRATDVAGAVSETLALTGATGESTQAALRVGLRHRQTLLVFDNFEQLLEALDDLLGLLDACPGVRLLVTSRTVLRCDAEVVVDLEPLGVPPVPPPGVTSDALDALARTPAVALFAQRAAAVWADFALDGGTAPTVARICEQVGGLPLAIELAAARLNVLSLPDLAARLERDPLTVLASGARDLPARQRSLRATLDWSLRLLEEPQRVVLEHVSAFESGFSLAGAEAVCTEPSTGPAVAGRAPLRAANVLDGMSALVDAHLVEPNQRQGGEPRFVLPVAVRDLMRERTGGAAREVLGRLDRHISSLGAVAGRELEGPDEQEWLDRIATDIDQIRAVLHRLRSVEPFAAVRLAADLGPFWLHRGLPAEGCYHLRPAGDLRARDDAERALLARAEAWDARLGADQEVPGDEVPYGEPGAEDPSTRLLRTLETAKEVGTVTDVLRVSEFLSNVLFSHRDDFDAAEAITADGVALARAHDQTWWLAQLLYRSAIFARRRGDTATAQRCAGEALHLARALRSDRLVVHASLTLLQLDGQTSPGETSGVGGASGVGGPQLPELSELLDLARSVRSPRSVAAVLQVTATRALLAGDYPAAATAYRDALVIGRDFGHRDTVGYSVMACAILASATRQPALFARLHGGAQTHLATLPRTIHGDYYGVYLDHLETQRAAAGALAFESDVALGKEWTWEQLVAETVDFTRRLDRSTGAGAEGAGARPLVPPAQRLQPAACGLLTDREQQVLELIARGNTNKDIARALGVSPKTVMHHSSHIYRKLGVRRRSEAAAFAARRSSA